MAVSPEQVKVLLEWCITHNVVIDSRLHLRPGPTGIGVHSGRHLIHPHQTLVKIPKDSVLSVRNCSLAGSIPFAPYGLDAQLSLALALFVELLNGRQSRWYGYLQSLPNPLVDLPMFWDRRLGTNDDDCEDGSEALSWLSKTEVAKILDERTEHGSTKLDEVTRFYDQFAEPLLVRSRYSPTLMGFYRAFSLVSSRAFLVDAYHGLSMVPIADAFNHVIEHHVHLESDYGVCPECGSLQECPHDREDGGARESTDVEHDRDHDLFYEMVSNTAIPPHTEVYNTYGEELTNAQLLTQYGFILDVDENDRLSWSLDAVLQFFPSGDAEHLMEKTRRISSLLSEEASTYAQSDLTYHDPTKNITFCINDEGKVSHQLWALLFSLATQSLCETQIHETLRSTLDFQLDLEDLEHDDDETESDGIANNLDQQDLNDDQHAPLDVLLSVARSVVVLCTARKRNSEKQGSAATDLNALIEELPEGRTRTRLAVSILLSERSILDCCEAGWTALLNSAGRLGYNSRPGG
ncbi:unnamed protein product [Cyclocybe aegerita]|uniref:SET domain-containing protein n=1 Tax=Cyclocybe aegerita TaxID=1973307 RepID=A0A8S0XF39_CYCAE|nr:unnamed protein product [Cyclocybe aegerita]